MNIPEGFVLVPASMHLDRETIGSINFHCGDGADGKFGEYSHGLLWVGAVTDDEGKEVHGLHLATAEYLEEGSTTLVEFPAVIAQSAAHLTIPGALEWDGDNGTHGVVGTHGADGESKAVPSGNYVQPVPEHCDRITWRGSYYHLPIAPVSAYTAVDMTTAAAGGFRDGQAKWIDCKDRMPEPDVEVLVSYTPLGQEKPIVHGAFLNKAFDDMDHLFWFNGKGESMRGVVKHWMPMIALPVSEEPKIQAAAFDDIPDFTRGGGNKSKRRIAAMEKARGGDQ